MKLIGKLSQNPLSLTLVLTSFLKKPLLLFYAIIFLTSFKQPEETAPIFANIAC